LIFATTSPRVRNANVKSKTPLALNTYWWSLDSNIRKSARRNGMRTLESDHQPIDLTRPRDFLELRIWSGRHQLVIRAAAVRGRCMRIARGRSAMGILVVAAALALAGCVTTSTTPTVSPAAAEGATIIFESVDGPPRPVSARLAKSLDQEAASRKLVVVTRGGQALYHIRTYVAAHVEGGQTTLAWALDVYDAERKRAFRLNGEERAAGASTWAAANDEVLRRIASTSVAQLMTFIASDRTGAGATAEAAPAQGPAPQGSLLAGAADDFRPEAAGIFRMFAAAPVPSAEADAQPVPLPPRRPRAAQRQNPPVLAYSVRPE
jgi:hypothetical protein